MFKKYGDIVEIMMKDDFAFVEFAHIHSAAKALGELNGARLQNQKIQVEEARPKEGDAVNPAFKSSMLRNSTNLLSNNEIKPTENTLHSRKRRIRMSPRRSLSRSRSRSLEKENRFVRY